MATMENQATKSMWEYSAEGLLIEDRKKYLQDLKKTILKYENEIYDALKSDLGRSKLETYLAEIYFTILEIDTTLKNIDQWAKPKRVGTNIHNFPARSWIQPSPKGVVLVISPWNYPFQLCLMPAIAALSAGNRVIMKPSEYAPKTASLLKKIVNETVPDHVMQVYEGTKEITQKLLDMPLDHIFFTGGFQTARLIAQHAAQTLTPVTYELGGKNPCIVDRNIDLTTACKRIMMAKFFNAGQTCIAPDFVVVDRKIHDEFIQTCQTVIKEFYPTFEDWISDFAHSPHKQHFEHLHQYLFENTWMPYQPDVKNLRLPPTLKYPCDWNDPLMKEEIFGPILPIISYQWIDEVLEKIKSWTPLALYIFSKNKDFQQQILKNTKSGGVCINDCMKQFTNIELPFGGIGKSGMGAYHAKAGFDTFSHDRSIMKRAFFFDKFSAYPPYKNLFDYIRRVVKS